MSQEDQVPVVGGEACYSWGTDADLNVASLGAVGDRHLEICTTDNPRNVAAALRS
jgi:hypothetical protein